MYCFELEANELSIGEPPETAPKKVVQHLVLPAISL